MNKCSALRAVIALSLIGLAIPAMSATPYQPGGAASTIAGPVVYGTVQEVTASPLYFNNVDRNHDGYVSRSEVPAQLHDLQAHFDQYDVDHDHRLGSQEYASFMDTIAQRPCRGFTFCGATNPYAIAKSP